MDNDAVVVYCVRITSRLEYIFSTLLSAIGITNYSLTSDVSLYTNSVLAKLNYSTSRLTPCELFINSVDLLFEDGVQDQAIKCGNFKETKAFYKTENSDFPFDIFAASFYLISRYEEYLPYKPDMYGRYAHENSIAFKESFLKEPVVNIWLKQFEQVLLEKHPSLQLSPSAFSFLPTYDIDIAYSYLHKGLLRNAGGMIRSLVRRELAMVQERINVIRGRQQDPFNSYEWLHKLHDEYELKAVYFFLLVGQNKDYDKNILPTKDALQQLIQQHAVKYDIGIHPSWQSGDKEKLLEKEVGILKAISGREINKSRQHYIRMNLPRSYRRLIEAGIREDYSMGYGSINGFRASYCLPYKWYDLAREKTTALTIFPFCYMDANSYYEQQYSCEEALEEISRYWDLIKKVNGLYISIWHNHFLGTDKMFRGWREVYEKSIGMMNDR
jgi:hypothetical protein